MYGLMKAHVCSLPTEEAQQRRLHYCGTCKTMGRLYGQKSRFLLNNDAVFLAELLTDLSPEPQPIGQWDRAYQSYNCFTLPDSEADMPLPLQVAASATLLMTEFKVRDGITDRGGRGWKLAQRLFSPEFIAATERMKGWGFPLEEIGHWGGLQESREAEACAPADRKKALEILRAVAEPTARVTGLVFAQSATVVGGGLRVRQSMEALGAALGELVYILDAYEDYDEDALRGDFNALQAAFQTGQSPIPSLPDGYRTTTLAHLHELRARMEGALRALPLPREQAAMFVARLRTNLAARLGELPKNRACVPSDSRSSLAAQWKPAVSLARTLTQQWRQQQPTALRTLLTQPSVFVSILAVALIFPRQALAATSYEECRDIAFNVIFWGAAVKGLKRSPMRLVPAFAMAEGPSDGASDSDKNPDPDFDHPAGSLTHSSSRKSSSVTVAKAPRRNRSSCCDGFDCCDDIVCCGDGCCCASDCCECINCC